MLSLIEGIRKVSVVAAFLFQCLSYDSYPNCLVWKDISNLTCWLECIHKRKVGYTPEVESFFKAYILFKTRKSIANDQGKRSVLLQAIKASPYVEIDNKLSTADKKIIRFTEKFRRLLNSLMQENTPEVSNRGSENYLISTNDLNMPGTSYQSDAVASETMSPVPDVDMADCSEEVASSFYPENGSSIHFSPQEGLLTNGGVSLSGLEQSAPPPEMEQSTLPMNEESGALYPPDYNPQEELLCSLRKTAGSPHNSLDTSVDSPNSAQSDFEMYDVCGVKLEGNRIHMLKDLGPSSPVAPTHYICSFRRRSNEQ